MSRRAATIGVATLGLTLITAFPAAATPSEHKMGCEVMNRGPVIISHLRADAVVDSQGVVQSKSATMIDKLAGFRDSPTAKVTVLPLSNGRLFVELEGRVEQRGNLGKDWTCTHALIL